MNSGVSNTRATCRPRGHFVQPAMLFGNFEIINIYIILFIHRCLKVLGQPVTSSFQTSYVQPKWLTEQKNMSLF